ncbi:MAG: sulfate transporter CysZ [Pseudomonadota bacterium]|nr:sulfate transporter CysZ [Pseudomonadota bacterium]
MLTHVFTGARYLFQGFFLVLQPGIRWFVIGPFMINITLLSLLIYYSWRQFESVMPWIQAQLPEMLLWLQWLLWPAFIAVMIIVIFFTFILVANLIATPFNGLLAQQVERRLTGQKHGSPNQSVYRILGSLFSMLAEELSKLSYYLSRVLGLLIITFIPPLTLIAPVLWLSLAAWMLAVEYLDYPMSNHEIKPKMQRKLLKTHRAMALGFGLSALVITFIPLVNFFAMPVAVAGATALWVNELADKHQLRAHL